MGSLKEVVAGCGRYFSSCLFKESYLVMTKSN